MFGCTVAGASLQGALRSIRINSGSNFGPYKGGPQPASATIVFYYRPGVSVPASIAVNATVIVNNAYVGFSTGNVFYGRIRDWNITATLDEQSNTYGKTVTLYATNVTADLNAILVRGVSTSALTKNETWEQRLTNTLQPYFGTYGGTFPSTGSEAHNYRLVDNNVDGTLVDHVNLACDSVGATWAPRTINDTSTFYAKGVYPKTGICFSDVDNYWNIGNRPANSVSTFGSVLNVLYSDIDVSGDTRELVNRINVTNVMPKNMVLSAASPGTLLWKSAQTNRPQNIEVLTAKYTAQASASISTYGVRAQGITTNLYPFRNSDTQTFYAKYNAALDPNVDYRGYINIQCSNANVRYSTATPYNGTQCLDAYATANGSSYTFVFGDTAGYPINWTVNQNAAQFQIAFRTPQANCRFQKGIQYLDSNGNVLLTQTTAVGVPTINVWQFYAGTYMDYTTIPAGAVSWRPIVILTHAGGNFTTGSLIGKFDAITFEPFLQPAALFTGDDADTSSTVQQWLGTPGDSVSYRINNILDNVGSDILNYWQDNQLRPRSITWNARLKYYSTVLLQPLARIDIRFQGTNYVSFINSYTMDIDTENCIITAELGYRPSSWN
jgi:hypothetical protein